MGQKCIGVRGDKGQVAKLLGVPCILFDCNQDDIDMLRKRSTPQVPLDGVVVCRGVGGTTSRPPVSANHTALYDSWKLVGIVKQFEAAVAPRLNYSYACASSSYDCDSDSESFELVD